MGQVSSRSGIRCAFCALFLLAAYLSAPRTFAFGDVCVPTTEICDGFDNDCDTEVDEDGPTLCNDGDLCTEDSCADGTCQYDPVACDDGDVCTGEETCVFGFGCVAGTPPDCEDYNPCTLDYCESGMGCRNDADDLGSCTDENPCTTDVCSGGNCVSTTDPCPDDGDPCTDAYCDPGSGCYHLSNDEDSDGACPYDNCPGIPNGDQSDIDGDGLGDACDPCPSDPLNDVETDGWCADLDNCPSDYNPDQEDFDGDAIGDFCDPCPADATNDYDGDGICGGQDNCPLIANPDQTDSDGNSVGDVCETVVVNFEPPFDRRHGSVPYLSDNGFTFDADRHYGWDAPVQTRYRGAEFPYVLNTFAFSKPTRRWSIELPNGDYDLAVVCGDPSYPQGPHRVSANGFSVIEDALTAAGEHTGDLVQVPVRNGRLEVEIGGTTGNTVLNLLEATRVGNGASYSRSINFQPAELTVPPGFEPDYGDPYDVKRGFGWSSPTTTVESNEDVPQVLDTFASSGETVAWQLDLPNGYYDVWLAAGDPNPASVGVQRVVLQGISVIQSEPTSQGKVIEIKTGAYVGEGTLTVEIAGGDGVTSLSYIVVALAGEDADGDGYENDGDICPFHVDWDQEDYDEDDLGDACDPDIDDDGIENFSDNCPMEWNDDLADSDGDGLGDACDSCTFDPYNDSDGDYVCGLSDRCPDAYDPDQTDSDGDGLGDACEFFRINFQPSSSQVPKGFRKDVGATYSSFNRYGWDSAVSTRDRVTFAPDELDTFAYTASDRSWSAEIPNGDYDVRVSVGDASFAQGPHRVSVQGTLLVDDLPTTGGSFVEASSRVSVRNGRLQLSMGGTEGLTMLNFVEAAEAVDPPTGIQSFSFQPPESAVAYGFTPSPGGPTSLEIGPSWSGAVATRERGRAVPQVLDTFAFSAVSRVWELPLANGWYHVWLSVGDASFAQGPQRVVVEGNVFVNDELTAPRQFLERDGISIVEDGSLTVEIGGGGGNTCLNYVVVEPAPVK